VPRNRTFIDLVPALPGDLDESATPGVAGDLLQSWSSELVRPQAARPGAGAVLPDGAAVVPYLATSWRADRRGDYTFQLRRGVRGQTGDLFTAADVRWSIARDLATSPVAPFLFALARLDTRNPVTVLGPYAVRINVTAPSPFMLGALSWFSEGIYDRRRYLAHSSTSDPWAQRWGATHSSTFGAYYVSDVIAGRRIVLLANPHSWVRPYYRRVEIRQVESGGRRVSDVIAGAADHTSGVDWATFTQVALYGSASHVRASILQSGPAVESWLLGEQHGALASVLVRRALSLAIDRSAISGRIYAGRATPDVLSIPPIYGHSQPAGYFAAQARELLAAAGYRHGLTLRVYVSALLAGGDVAKELALLSTELAQVGVTLRPTIVYNDDQLLALRQAHRLPSTIEDIAPLIGGAAFSLIENYDARIDPASPAAADGYTSPAVAALLSEIDSTLPGARLQRLVSRAGELIDADVPQVNLVEVPVQNVTRSEVTGYGAYAVPVTYYEYLHPSR